MGRWRDSWAARNPSVRLAWPMPQTRLPLWFRATGSSALMEVLPDMAAASVGSAGCSFTRGSLWRSLPRDAFQKRHESLKQRRCSANELAETPRRLRSRDRTRSHAAHDLVCLGCEDREVDRVHLGRFAFRGLACVDACH